MAFCVAAIACIFAPSISVSLAPTTTSVSTYSQWLCKKNVILYLEACSNLANVCKKALIYLNQMNFKQMVKLEYYFRNLVSRYFKTLLTVGIKDQNLPSYLRDFGFGLQGCDAAFATLPNIEIAFHTPLNHDVLSMVYEYSYRYQFLNIKISRDPHQLFAECVTLFLECQKSFVEIYKLLDG